MKGDNIRETFRKVALQKATIEVEASPEKVIFEVKAKDSATFVHLFVEITHQKMATLMAKWFVHLPKVEQEHIIATMQRIVEARVEG